VAAVVQRPVVGPAVAAVLVVVALAVADRADQVGADRVVRGRVADKVAVAVSAVDAMAAAAATGRAIGKGRAISSRTWWPSTASPKW
jgi:hypothetical protein